MNFKDELEKFIKKLFELTWANITNGEFLKFWNFEILKFLKFSNFKRRSKCHNRLGCCFFPKFPNFRISTFPNSKFQNFKFQNFKCQNVNISNDFPTKSHNLLGSIRHVARIQNCARQATKCCYTHTCIFILYTICII